MLGYLAPSRAIDFTYMAIMIACAMSETLAAFVLTNKLLCDENEHI